VFNATKNEMNWPMDFSSPQISSVPLNTL